MNTRFSSAITLENSRGFIAVIPDIKCRSPKEGDLLQERNPVDIAKHLVLYGAPVLSVVTEQENFGGSKELLHTIAQTVNVPILRKDFIKHEDQLLETMELGASAVLLICATTDEKDLEILYKKSIQLGLEPLVEVHTEQEMEFAHRLGARLIGINNRDITTLEKDDGGPKITTSLVSGAPTGSLIISESGILSPDDVALAQSAGANAVLIGTALWQAADMDAAYKSFRIERRNTL